MSSRRSFITALACGLWGSPLLEKLQAADKSVEDEAEKNTLLSSKDAEKVKFALNFGTILGYNLNLMQELEIAREAGYRSVEIWLNRLADYTKDGDRTFAPNKLAELKKWLDGEGIQVENGIGFATWIENDPDKRAAGLDELKRQAEALAALGCPCVATPAARATKENIENLNAIADRYAAALDACATVGVRAILELWGASPTLHDLGDCLAICAKTKRPDAALLLDAYHLYRGGNSFDSLKLVSGNALPVFHMNDYPGSPEREKLTDADRVYPGDGVCPLKKILRILLDNGFAGVLSLELFNKNYREQTSALEQAKIGLAKMRSLFA